MLEAIVVQVTCTPPGPGLEGATVPPTALTLVSREARASAATDWGVPGHDARPIRYTVQHFAFWARTVSMILSSACCEQQVGFGA
jgi:hypothetical protein